MIREDLRSRRVAVIADFVVNPGSALYGRRPAPPSGFVEALMARGWGVIKMPPHVAKPESCQRLVEMAVGDMIDYAKNGYAVVIATASDLPGQGVWLEAMAACFRDTGKAMPPIVALTSGATAADVDALDRAVAPAA